MNMLKKLILKELKLGIHPALYLFTLLAALMLIPNYPHMVAMLYFFLGLQIAFSLMRANKDIEFTAVLPITRNDIIKSKMFVAVWFQLLQLLVAVPFALIACLLITPSGNVTGLDANFAFFGEVLIAYSMFNLILFPMFFKTGYKLGWPLCTAMIGFALTAILIEVVIAVTPALNSVLDSLNPANFGWQLLMLGIGVLFYIITLICSYKISTKRYEKVNN